MTLRHAPGVFSLALSRLMEAVGAGIVCIALPSSVAVLPAGSFACLPETARIGLLIAVFGLALAVAQPIAGALADRHVDRRVLALAGLLCCALTTAALGVAADYNRLLLLRIAQGLGMGLVVPTTLSLITSLEKHHQRGAALGFYGSVRMLGFGLGPILGGALLVLYEPRFTYGLCAALVLLSCLPLLRVPSTSWRVQSDKRTSLTARIQARPQAAGSLAALSLAAFIASSSVTCLVVLQNEFRARLGQSTLGFGVALSSMLFTRMLLSWPIGRLSDRMSRRKLLLAGLAVLAVCTTFLGLARTTTELVALRILMGVGMALFFTPSLSLVSDSFGGGARTFRISLLTTSFSLGMGLGPLLTGILAASFSFQAPLVFWGAAGLLSSLWLARALPSCTRSPSAEMAPAG